MKTHNRSAYTLAGVLFTPLLAMAQAENVAEQPSTSPAAPVATPEVAPAASAPVVQTEAAPAAPTEPAAEPVVAPASDVSAAAPVVAPAPASASSVALDLTPLVTKEDSAAVVPATPDKPKDTLSVDFPDEDIRNILRNVADLFELNIVIPDALQGRTSVKLRDVSWRQIFKVVLTPVGYTFVEDGNIIKVVTVDSLAQEPLNTEVHLLNYARAEDVEKSILPLVDSAGGGRVLVDKRINALIISERPSRLGRIIPVLQSLDTATEQVMIESKFIEVNNTDVTNLGINWSSLNNYQVGYSPADLLMTGSDRDKVGTNTGGLTPGPSPASAGTAYGAVLTAPQFNVALSALQSLGDSKIVSNPTIVTLNNTAAEINVGEEYPIPSYTYNAERGSFEISGFEYKPIGVLLKVTPQVNSQGFVRLNLEPEISIRGGDVAFGGASGATIPIIRTRKTKTQVSMKDGHTLAIGGLIDSTDINGQTKVPVLGDVPGIGRLFRSKKKDQAERNLLIFITSKVVSSESAAVQDVFSQEQVQKAGLKRGDIGGVRSSADPFLPETVPAPAEATSKK